MSTATVLIKKQESLCYPRIIEDRPDLQAVVADILALRQMWQTHHFVTHKSQREILSRLCPDDLACVAKALEQAEKRKQLNMPTSANQVTH